LYNKVLHLNAGNVPPLKGHNLNIKHISRDANRNGPRLNILYSHSLSNAL